jgi:hypothetical protein
VNVPLADALVPLADALAPPADTAASTNAPPASSIARLAIAFPIDRALRRGAMRRLTDSNIIGQRRQSVFDTRSWDGMVSGLHQYLLRSSIARVPS